MFDSDDGFPRFGSYPVQSAPPPGYWGGALARWAGGYHRLRSVNQSRPTGRLNSFVSFIHIGLTDKDCRK